MILCPKCQKPMSTGHVCMNVPGVVTRSEEAGTAGRIFNEIGNILLHHKEVMQTMIDHLNVLERRIKKLEKKREKELGQHRKGVKGIDESISG